MRRTCSRLLLVLLGSLAVVTVAPGAEVRAADADDEIVDADQAAYRSFRFEFGLFGGAHFYTRDHGLGRSDDDPQGYSPRHGGAFGGRLGLNFSRWVALEGEVMASPTQSLDEATEIWAFGYRGSLLLHLAETPAFRPFLLLGYGAMTTIVNDPPPRDDTDGFLHAGLGFKIGFGDRAGLRLEGRVMVPGAIAGKVIPVGDETGYGGPDFEALGTLFINFDEVPSTRMIVRREVMMAPPPPPPSDPDGDGIAGKMDRCPEIAEDKDGFEDQDGCPEGDNDGDGIPDPLDKCPLRAEDKNGVDDDDGCPEEDVDGDGLLGSRDQCPNEAETKNNYRDGDGCPDEVPVEVKKFTGVIEGINFKTGSAEILPGSYAVLDRAVKVLKEFKDVNLEISGHTDSRGSAEYNRNLSQRRAESVKTFFIRQGVDAARLISIGYGEDRPVADNSNQSGRGRNRRTEFRLINPGER